MSGVERLNQDYLLVNGEKSPGKCTITDGGEAWRWIENQGFGLAGANLLLGGKSLSRFTALFQIWEDPQLTTWDAFKAKYFDKPILVPPPNGVFLPNVKALGVGHPVLQRANIASAVVLTVGIWTQDDKGLWSCPVAFIEYKAPLALLGRANQGVPAAGAPKNDARTAQEIEIDNLTDRLKRLGEIDAKLSGGGG